jgi:quercetin dioxygenase-like cupin family protein
VEVEIMRIRFTMLALLLATLSSQAFAQSEPISTVRMSLAFGRLPSVIDMPLFFRLYRVSLPVGQLLSYDGSTAMLYSLSGPATIDIDGTVRSIAEGEAVSIPAGNAATIGASGSESGNLLLFVLTPRPNQRKPLLRRPAGLTELCRTPDPLPGLQAGPYELSLTRVTLPAGMPADQPHFRSGAALNYVLAGTVLFTAEGKTEGRTAGTTGFELNGLVYQWANPGDTPLVLLQANLSREGMPAVAPASTK